MKVRTLLRRLRTSAQALRNDPQALLRLPAFALRMLQEGPVDTLARLRQISDPWRFVQNYSTWLERHHDPTPDELAEMAAWARGLKQPPLISVLMPVYNPQPQWLAAAIESVKQQCYPHWQLCIADDSSSDPEVRRVLEQEMALDSRIQVVFRTENGHISCSSNSALELVRGDWVALLDHDDLLPPEALAWVAFTALEKPCAQLIYSDEDKINEEGVRTGPYFKPDWNAALIEGQNLFSHLGVYRADLIRRVGGFRQGLEGSQDYDLLLRCLDAAGDQAVEHIPRVLYHWRVHRESTASGNGAKPYVVAAAERALVDHLQRRGEQGEVRAISQGYRIQRPPAEAHSMVAVLLDARGVPARQLHRSVNSLVAGASEAVGLQLQLVLAEDQQRLQGDLEAWAAERGVPFSCDRLPQELSAPEVLGHLIAAEPAGALLLWDARLRAPESGDWLVELLSQLVLAGVAAVGPKLVYPNGTISHAGLLLSRSQLAAPAHRGFGAEEAGYWGRANLLQHVSALPLPGLLLRREAVEACGGLLGDPALLPHWGLDLCLRLREIGQRLTYSPFAELLWCSKVMQGPDPWPGSAVDVALSAERMRQRWVHWLEHDPAFSPNLCNDPINYSLAWPPRLARWSDLGIGEVPARDAGSAAGG